MRRMLCVLLLILGLCFAGCADQREEILQSNAPETLEQVPYAFSGSQGDWTVRVQVRAVTQADLDMVQELPDGYTLEDLANGYRSVYYIQYQGEADFTALRFYFATGTQWVSGSQLQVSTAPSITPYLTGTEEVGGNYFSADGTIGGPLPPRDRDYPFHIEATTAQGETVTVDLALTAQPQGES